MENCNGYGAGCVSARYLGADGTTGYQEQPRNLYLVGQYISYPELLSRLPQPSGRPRLPLPGQPGFDRWLMTDPSQVKALSADPGVVKVIEDMWALDPDPQATLALWDDIAQAKARGAVKVAQHPNGAPVGYYFCAPYAAIYEAVQSVVIGTTAIRPGQRFTLECSPEGVRLGYPFKREVVLGRFQAAALDYCDPDAPPPHE